MIVTPVLEELELRPLAPYEQWELFNESLEKAQTRLLITSEDVDPAVTHSIVLRKLDERLDQGVEVRIETSAVIGAVARGRAGSFEPAVELWLRGQQKHGFTLAQRSISPGDLYFLIRDEDLAIISNRPFLNGREKPLSFIPTVGIVTQHPDVVADIARLAGADGFGISRRGVSRGRG